VGICLLFFIALHQLCFACIGGTFLADDVLLLVFSFYPGEYFGSVCKHWEQVFSIHLNMGMSRHLCITGSYPSESFEKRYRSSNALYLRVRNFSILRPLKLFQNLLFLRIGVHNINDYKILRLLCAYQNSKLGHEFHEVSFNVSILSKFPCMRRMTHIKTYHLDLSCVFSFFLSAIGKLGGSFPTTKSLSLRLHNLDSRPFLNSLLVSFRFLLFLHIQCAPFIPHSNHLHLSQLTDAVSELRGLISLTCYLQNPDLNILFDVWGLSGEGRVRVELHWISVKKCPFVFCGEAADDLYTWEEAAKTYSWEYRSSSAAVYYFAYVLRAGMFMNLPADPIPPGTYARGSTTGYVVETRVCVPKAHWYPTRRKYDALVCAFELE
jgi:hypothetical protein